MLFRSLSSIVQLPHGLAYFIPETTSIGLIGIANLVGTLSAGWLSVRFRLKSILFWLYLSRAATLGLFLLALVVTGMIGSLGRG